MMLCLRKILCRHSYRFGRIIFGSLELPICIWSSYCMVKFFDPTQNAKHPI